MTGILKKIAFLSLSALFFAQAGFAQNQNTSNEALLKQISRGFSNVAKKATPAVVYIESQSGHDKPEKTLSRKGSGENPFDYFNDDFFYRFFGFPFERERPSQKNKTIRGSGFLISKDGYIVTNNHVVEKANKVSVTLSDGEKKIATVIGVDPKTDLAVIKVEGINFPHLNFGDSEALEVGDWAIAVGNPFGLQLQATVTVGVVSAKGRNQLHIADFEDFIQTDAAINPGNSGGPLLDIQGEVIGVNTAIVSESGGYLGIGFAIPSNMAKQIVSQLIKEGQVTRGYLGVTLQPIDNDLASFYKLKKIQGALVTDVIKGSPADLAGLQQEDIILNYNNTPVENLASFRNFVSFMPPGSNLQVRVLRAGQEADIQVTVTKMPNDTVGPNNPVHKLGLEVQDLTPELAKKLNFSDSDGGVVVTQVKPGSPAADASLQAGSLIMAVNRQKVHSVAEFSDLINASNKEERVLLMVRQGEAVRFVALRW